MRRPLSLAACAMCALSLLAGSCGGGGGEETTSLIVFAGSEAIADGTAGGSTDTSAQILLTGDNDFIDSGTLMPVPVSLRCFWSFDISAIPPTATVLSAAFSTYQNSVIGMPYSDHGVVTLDHVDYGPSLDALDFNVAAIAPAFATLSADPGLGTKTVDVTAQVQADLVAARTRTQFRARFSTFDTDNDGIADHALFTCAESPAHTPVLVITYEP